MAINLNALRDEIREGFEVLLAKEDEALLAISQTSTEGFRFQPIRVRSLRQALRRLRLLCRLRDASSPAALALKACLSWLSITPPDFAATQCSEARGIIGLRMLIPDTNYIQKSSNLSL